MDAPAGSPSAAQKARLVEVDRPITLGQFLKLAGLVPTGGDAKRLVATGRVRLNGTVEVRRGRQLQLGDIVEVEGVAVKSVDSRAGQGPPTPPDARPEATTDRRGRVDRETQPAEPPC